MLTSLSEKRQRVPTVDGIAVDKSGFSANNFVGLLQDMATAGSESINP